MHYFLSNYKISVWWGCLAWDPVTRSYEYGTETSGFVDGMKVFV
jgi:hypothetical protein